MTVDCKTTDEEWVRFLTFTHSDPNTGCRLWAGAVAGGQDGEYGVFRLSEPRRMAYAHRIAWTRRHGPIPDDLELDHRCRTKLCTNEDHLEPVTHLVNNQRKPKPSHCPQGHEYTHENTRYINGGMACRECGREANRAWRRRRAA